MDTLRRTASIDSFELIRQDTAEQISTLRKDGLVGTPDSDPLLAIHLPRVEIGIRAVSHADVLRRDHEEQAYPSLFGLLTGLFSTRIKESMTNEKLKRRGMRDLKDARKTITTTVREREDVLAICQYAFGEIYVRDFDDKGPKFDVKLMPQQCVDFSFLLWIGANCFMAVPESTKECLYERSRVLRYLSLRIMSTSRLFSAYHRPEKTEEIMKALNRSGRETLTNLKSKLGASPEYRATTHQLMRLLNETIVVNVDAQNDRRFEQIIRAAEMTVESYETFMNLEKSQKHAAGSQRRALEALIVLWQESLSKYKLSTKLSHLNLTVNDISESFFPPDQTNEDKQVFLREKLLEEPDLKVLLKGRPDSAGIRKVNRVKGSFGETGKYLLPKPATFPSVPWPVSELAVKTVRVEIGSRDKEVTWRSYKRIVRELRVWCKMRHERIVPILGVWDTQEQDTIFCMVSPWISDDQLDHYVMNVMKDRPQNSEALTLMHDIASGLSYMHNFGAGAVHGDLKPDNILVRNGRAFITDFGLSHDMDGIRGLASEVHGNPAWLAPEAITAKCEKGSGKQTFKPTFAQDMYSFGCLFFFVTHREMPFEKFGDSPAGILTKRKEYPYENPISMKDALRLHIDHCCLMLECWRLDPSLRITARLALEHVERLIELEKNRRSGNTMKTLQLTAVSSNKDNNSQRSSTTLQWYPSQDLLSKSRPSVSQSKEVVYVFSPWETRETNPM